ncbi:hypothetical protein [Shewanella atlantica]|uniref:hypothetical protein n=1 Tax=Shewanella atlantica TaxID=271099 RepID=UPI0037364E8A
MRAFIYWLVIVSFPYILWALENNVEWGLIPLAVEIVFFLPISWVGEPFFTYTSDIGGSLPSAMGRFVGVISYSIFYWGLYQLFSKYRKT